MRLTEISRISPNLISGQVSCPRWHHQKTRVALWPKPAAILFWNRLYCSSFNTPSARLFYSTHWTHTIGMYVGMVDLQTSLTVGHTLKIWSLSLHLKTCLTWSVRTSPVSSTEPDHFNSADYLQQILYTTRQQCTMCCALHSSIIESWMGIICWKHYAEMQQFFASFFVFMDLVKNSNAYHFQQMRISLLYGI